MKTIAWILLLSMILYSCSSTYTISHAQSDYLELNEKLEGKQTTITLVNDTVIVGENVGIRDDFTSWNETHPGAPPTTKYVNTLAIKQIAINNRAKSASIGGYIGLPIGIAGAYLYIDKEESKGEKGEGNIGILFVVIGELILGMAIGAAVGALVGYVVGYPETYNFIASEDSTDLSTNIVEYYKEDKTNDENEPIPDTEVEPPILQSDGNYKINVSSLKWRKQEIIITWHGKRIYLQKSDVVNSWKSGDKSYIIVPPALYESKFKEE